MKRTVIVPLVALLCCFATRPARAESIAIGVFVGQPTGLDLKIGLKRRSALDIVLGASDYDDGRGRASYGHLTYLALLTVARGQSVNVPIRLGIGGALIGVTESDTTFAARVPLQIGLRFRRTPLEIYGEVAFMLYLIDDVDTGADGGIGLRVYF
jgi:hypothetical protein